MAAVKMTPISMLGGISGINIESPLPLEHDYSSSGSTKEILIETMQLVAPLKEIPVPNHILDSSKSDTIFIVTF